MLRNLIYSHQNDNEKAVDSLLELNKDDIERNVRFNLPEMGDKLLSDDADHDQPVLSMIENERLLYLNLSGCFGDDPSKDIMKGCFKAIDMSKKEFGSSIREIMYHRFAHEGDKKHTSLMLLWECLDKCILSHDLEGAVLVLEVLIQLQWLQFSDVKSMLNVISETNFSESLISFVCVKTILSPETPSQIVTKMLSAFIQLYVQAQLVLNDLVSVRRLLKDFRSKITKFECDILKSFDCLSQCCQLIELSKRLSEDHFSDVFHNFWSDPLLFSDVVQKCLIYTKNTQQCSSLNKQDLKILLKDLELSFNLPWNDTMIGWVEFNSFYLAFLIGIRQQFKVIPHIQKIQESINLQNDNTLKARYNELFARIVLRFEIHDNILPKVMSLKLNQLDGNAQMNESLLLTSWLLYKEYGVLPRSKMLTIVADYIESIPRIGKSTVSCRFKNSSFFSMPFSSLQKLVWKMLVIVLDQSNPNSGELEWEAEKEIFKQHRNWWMRSLFCTEELESNAVILYPPCDVNEVLNSVDSMNSIDFDQIDCNCFFNQDIKFDRLKNKSFYEEEEEEFESLDIPINFCNLIPKTCSTEVNNCFLLSCDPQFAMTEFFANANETKEDYFTERKFYTERVERIHNTKNLSSVFKGAIHNSGKKRLYGLGKATLEALTYQAVVAFLIEGQNSRFLANVVYAIVNVASVKENEIHLTALSHLNYLRGKCIDLRRSYDSAVDWIIKFAKSTPSQQFLCSQKNIVSFGNNNSFYEPVY